MPDSFSAFCNIVSLTAANTRRMLEVSVACVRLQNTSANQLNRNRKQRSLLRIKVKVGTVDLVKPPKKIFGGSSHIITTRVIGEVI